ncbi:hypothetical protein QZL00_26645, partial [Escherichia coli]|nr:hypothetical protein [Escherichia coli]
LLTANFEIDPGSGWIYFQATLKCLPEWGMVGTQLQIAADRAVGSFATGDWIEVTTPQFEYGACATSFIITTTEPATRASDLCKFPLMKICIPCLLRSWWKSIKTGLFLIMLHRVSLIQKI